MPPKDPLGLVGTEIGARFSVESVVHHGASSVVYRGRHLGWDQAVALEVFAPDPLRPAPEVGRLRERFVRTGAIMTKLSAQHAAVIHTRDCDVVTAKGRPLPFLVFEWFEGRTLDRVLDFPVGESPSQLGAEETIHLFEGVLEALALAHDAGLVHADLRPANLMLHGGMLAPGATIKLLDFSRHCIVEPGGGAKASDDPGAMVSPSYAAPEQLRGDASMIGPWTDVYSMALVLVEVMLGRPALAGDDEAKVMQAATDPIRRPTPRTLGVNISDPLEAAFAQALAVPTHARFRSMIDFRRALMAATSATGAARSRDPRATMVVSERDGLGQRSGAAGAFDLGPSTTSSPDLLTATVPTRVRVAKSMRDSTEATPEPPPAAVPPQGPPWLKPALWVALGVVVGALGTAALSGLG